MRGGVWPPALLFAALGLALAFVSRKAWALSLVALCASLGAMTFLPVPNNWLEGVFLGCWISVIVTAANVQFVRGPSQWAAIALSLNAGLWASAVISLSGSAMDLLKALPCVLIFFPASWVIARHGSIPVKVVSSWIIAVAMLAATLQLLPVTPGYLPDHIE